MSEDVCIASKFLIVDDELANVMVLEQLLEQWGCTRVRSTTDPCAAREIVTGWQPDIVLLDLHMPVMDGYQVMEQLRQLVAIDDYLPVLVLTADTTPGTRRKALEHGASDFLAKPFDKVELALRCSNLLKMRNLHSRLKNQNVVLEERVAQRTQDLKQTQIGTLECLAAAAEYRDDDTGQHTRRVGDMAARLAVQLGLPERLVVEIGQAAPLHDVGKIGVSDTILLKPGKLTPDEFALMKHHAAIGEGILSRHQTRLLQLAASIAVTHHERWDGTGYPMGLKGEDIPIEGRIVAVTDVFDALTNERPYKKAWPVAEAIAEIQKQSGAQFDPAVVDAFLQLQHPSPN